jgi:hypothetical protein
MSTAIAALAQRSPVLACEREKECFELARKLFYEFGYGMAARGEILIPEAQRAILSGRTPGPEAVDIYQETDEDGEPAQGALENSSDRSGDAE